MKWVLENHDSIKSTQDIVKGAAAIGHPEGMVVQAAKQTGGYGRHGREWISEKGNLYLSLLLRPSCSIEKIGQLSLLCGLAVAESVQKHIDDPSLVSLKWPNDVMIDGKKCAGLLLESDLAGERSVKWLAVGVGLNISCAPPDLGTCIDDHREKTGSVEAIQKDFLDNLARYYKQWIAEGFGDIRAAWLALAHEKGQKLKVRIGPQIEQGLFYDVDGDGNLLLHDSELRVKKVSAGEVYT